MIRMYNGTQWFYERRNIQDVLRGVETTGKAYFLYELVPCAEKEYHGFFDTVRELDGYIEADGDDGNS